MFYVLNFDDHSFFSCDTADKAEREIRSMLSCGHTKDSIEVINGFDDGVRLGVEEFRAFGQEQGLFEEMLLSDPVDSWEAMEKKYPTDRAFMDEVTEEQFVKDCFELYEKEGFSPLYWSPYEDNKERVGQKIEIIGRCEDGAGFDLEVLPMWSARFADGHEIDVYPEEIIPSEMKSNGCRWFDEVLVYDDVIAKNVAGLDVDVLSPQEMSNAMGKAVRDAKRFYLPEDIATKLEDVIEQAEGYRDGSADVMDTARFVGDER